MVVGFVVLYLAASIAVGLYAATRVRGTSDYAVAGKRFGTAIVAATVFATWFGAETVLGIPAAFWKEGLGGVIADPFAALARSSASTSSRSATISGAATTASPRCCSRSRSRCRTSAGSPRSSWRSASRSTC